MNLKNLLILISLSLCLGISDCKGRPPELEWHPNFYIGDAGTQSFQGSQEILKCSDIKINDLIAVHKIEISNLKKEYNENINLCLKWASPQAEIDAKNISNRLDQIEKAVNDLRDERPESP